MWDDVETMKAVVCVVARELHVMGQLQIVRNVIECANHVTVDVNVRVIVGILITMCKV